MSTHEIRMTSLFAFSEAKHNLGAKQQAVYEVIKNYGPITNLQISQKLGFAINSTTPRVKELRDLNMVEESGIVKDFTGRSAIAWKVKWK